MKNGSTEQAAGQLLALPSTHDRGVHPLESGEDVRDLVLMSWLDTVGNGGQ